MDTPEFGPDSKDDLLKVFGSLSESAQEVFIGMGTFSPVIGGNRKMIQKVIKPLGDVKSSLDELVEAGLIQRGRGNVDFGKQRFVEDRDGERYRLSEEKRVGLFSKILKMKDPLKTIS